MPNLPAELLLIIFQFVTDKSTVFNTRLCSKFAYRCITTQKAAKGPFSTLVLDRSRQHSARRFKKMVELGLSKYVDEVVICTSCYFEEDGRGTKVDTFLRAYDLYGDEAGLWNGLRTRGKQYAYTGDLIYKNPDEVQNKLDIEELFDDFPNEFEQVKKHKAFLTHVLKTLALHSTNRPKRLRLEIKVDQSATEVSLLGSKKLPSDNYSFCPTHILQLPVLVFTDLLGRIFTDNQEIFEPLLDIYEVSYMLRHHMTYYYDKAEPLPREVPTIRVGNIDLDQVYWKDTGLEYLIDIREATEVDVKIYCCNVRVDQRENEKRNCHVTCRRQYGKTYNGYDKFVGLPGAPPT